VPGVVPSLRPRVEIPSLHRRPFLVALPVVVAAWALGGLYASLGPSLVAQVFGVDNHVVGSLIILALNGTGVLGSLAMRSVVPEKALMAGALTFAVGVAGTIVAVLVGSLALLFIAAVITGFGFGASFFGAITMITAGVAPRHRAGLLAATFVVGYLAFSLPAIAAGLATSAIGLARTTEIYGAAVIVLALLAAGSVALRRRGRRPAEASCPENEALAA
jgi:MFS family permease